LAKTPTFDNITAGFGSATKLNANFDAVETAFNNTLSLDGSTPNTMAADLDLGGNDILNVATINAGNIAISGVDLDARVTAADASATAAAVSETNAAATLDEFDDIYLGSKAANPTVDNDGNALQTGALFFHTGTPEMRVWNGAAWDPLSTPSGSGTVTSVGIVDSGSTEFTVTTTPVTTTGNITLAVATIAGTKIDYSAGGDLDAAVVLKAPIASPTFTGVPAAPTAVTTTNTTQIATTAFVQQEIASGTDTFSTALLHIQDQQTNGTSGGTFTSGAWRTRTLNTAITNEISGASLSSNQITLPAGTFWIEASAPAVSVQEHKAKLVNISDVSDTILGTSAFASNANTGATCSSVSGRFTIAGAKVFEIQHQGSTTKSTTGFGRPSTFSVIEVYSDVKIWKVG